MKKLQPVRGTRDLLPPLSHHFKSIEAQAFSLAKLFGFSLIETPIFEFSDVFHRTLGETSDVVTKETYDFTDRGGDSLTLRPEGTAGVARAFVSEGLSQHLPLKYYYSGPMFRHERPQKGRYRQFTQMGVEALGYENPRMDVEVISLGYSLLKAAGLEKKCILNLNTLGDLESRLKYREALTEYFEKYRSELSAESQERLNKNPLRILDSKSEADQKISLSAPRFEAYMSPESVQFFSQVKAGLEALEIPYVINPQLVRGLDYYCHTVFEFVTTELGAQGTVLAGGRYDGLIQQMGGPQVPGVGWGAGLDRLADLIELNRFEKEPTKVGMISADDSTDLDVLKLTHHLRLQSVQSSSTSRVFEIIDGSKMGKKIQKADKQGFHYVIIMGESEKQSASVVLKNLKTGNQETLKASVEALLEKLV